LSFISSFIKPFPKFINSSEEDASSEAQKYRQFPQKMCGHPFTRRMHENVEWVHELINQKKHITIHDLCEEINLSDRSCQHILLGMNKRKFSSMCVDFNEFNTPTFLVKGYYI
jgi:hypothetical protein